MAIGIQSWVRLKLSSADFAPGAISRINPQPPLFAIVQAGAAPWDIRLTQTGQELLAVPATILSEITAPDAATITAWLNKIVLPQGFSQEFTAEVVDVFQVAGEVGLLVPHLLCKTLSGGLYYEIDLTLVSAGPPPSAGYPNILSNR